ncbi:MULTISPECIES: sulfurtransferase TusA family protein [Methanoculleus]|jgi:tRNA 2-thiouridine synthesizing protein A|uniref:Sulfurtransferase TusA family protein n=1 Tax=Methanoculleus palmolei TaxID=72612 RepID=A0ABD8AA68_9EURY|nr:sulfurtransferase TusA family protein [Methanoculleus sp. UBA377]WOX55481.1 sulfurtransferase TusA family protein [Methanoculleus palmolei]
MGDEVKKRVDLAGVVCPMNFVKTKLALEDLEPGDLLEVILDEGSAMLNVPRSVKEEGHRIVKVEPLGESFRVVIEKGGR